VLCLQVVPQAYPPQCLQVSLQVNRRVNLLASLRHSLVELHRDNHQLFLRVNRLDNPLDSLQVNQQVNQRVIQQDNLQDNQRVNQQDSLQVNRRVNLLDNQRVNQQDNQRVCLHLSLPLDPHSQGKQIDRLASPVLNLHLYHQHARLFNLHPNRLLFHQVNQVVNQVVNLQVNLQANQPVNLLACRRRFTVILIPSIGNNSVVQKL
jgi:hypothetical protein